MRPDRLFDAVSTALNGNEIGANSIVREGLFVSGWLRQGETIAEVQDAIREALKASWTDQNVEKWKTLEQPLAELLALPALRLVASTIDLSYEYTNLWRGARILTDIRPIFNEEVTAVDGAVVSHTFRLRFDAVDGHHELSIAMDEADIKILAKQCERATIE